MSLVQSPKDTTVVLEHIPSAAHLFGVPNAGTGVDTTQVEFIYFVLHTTATAQFTGMTIVLQHSDNNSTWTTDQTIASPGNFSDFKAILVRTTGFKRYIRLVVTPLGGTWSGGALVICTGVESTTAASSVMSWYDEILTPGG